MASGTTTTVAVLGTGIMGSAIVERLLDAGFPVSVWNRTSAHVQPLGRLGARLARDPGDAVEGADVVLTTLTDAAAVLDVAAQFVAHVNTGALWIQCGTIGLDATRKAAALAAGAEVTIDFIDAPVLGTRSVAESGDLVVLAGAPNARLDAARPVLSAYSARVVHAGDTPGAGTALKLACNTWIAMLTAGAAQALEVARAEGIDPRLFLEAIDGTASDSPYAHVKGTEMLLGDFATQFATSGIIKDLRLARSATQGKVSTELLDALETLFERAGSLGHSLDDIGSVVTAFTPDPAPVTRGPAHIGLTVPDLDEATTFLEAALGARVSYTTLTTADAPRQGPDVERQLDLPAGASIVGQRFLQIGTGPGIELFQMRAASHRPAASLTDFGWEHLAFYVDDIRRPSTVHRLRAQTWSPRCTATPRMRTRPAAQASTCAPPGVP